MTLKLGILTGRIIVHLIAENSDIKVADNSYPDGCARKTKNYGK